VPICFRGGINLEPTGKNIGETDILIFSSPLFVTTKESVVGLSSLISALVGATKKELAADKLKDNTAKANNKVFFILYNPLFLY